MGKQLSDLEENILEKQKLLVTSNFFFSYNVFKSGLLLMHQNEYLWSKGLSICNQSVNAVTGCGCGHFISNFLCAACDRHWEDHETFFETEQMRVEKGLPVGM